MRYWLCMIASTQTGQALLRAIAPPSRLIIESDQDAENRTATPGTGPEDGQNRDAWRAATREGARARHGAGGLIGGFGTGKGTTASIEFTPADFINEPPEDQPDIVLVHEIAHATRYLDGVVSNAPMLEYGFLTREEVHAVLIGNMYRSEIGLATFRLSHRPSRSGSLQQALQTFRLGKDMLRLLAGRQEHLYEDLANINTRFNPVREFIS